MVRSISIFFIISFTALAEVVTQDDWSGGPGILGPVNEWGGFFYSHDNMEYQGGDLHLLKSVGHSVGYLSTAGGIDSGDIDADGDADIVSCSSNEDVVLWYENVDGTGISWVSDIIDSGVEGPNSTVASDIDGDGDIDVLGTVYWDDDIIWWENTSGGEPAWIKHIIDGNVNGAQGCRAADINGDGYTDAVGICYIDDYVSWWENIDGSGQTWTEHVIAEGFLSTIDVCVSDIDGDGDQDVAGASYEMECIRWWENTNGSGSAWTEHVVDAVCYNPESIAEADIDADGDCDLLYASGEANQVIWAENVNGSGTVWNEHIIVDNFACAWVVHACDINEDGYVDVVSTSYTGDMVTWWENSDTSPGQSWNGHLVESDFPASRGIGTDDLNGDGKTDVFGYSWGQSLRCWDLSIYAADAILESSILGVFGVESWDNFSSNSTQPPNTSIGYQLRSSADWYQMGNWSAVFHSSDTTLTGILSDSTRYLQYRIILETSDPEQTPVIESVSFDYSYSVNTDEHGSELATCWGLHPIQNPSIDGMCSVRISLPRDAYVELDVYDISGRLVRSLSGQYEEGSCTVNIGELTDGIFFCVMRSDQFHAVEKVAVLN